jgi:hypothetical protein
MPFAMIFCAVSYAPGRLGAGAPTPRGRIAGPSIGTALAGSVPRLSSSARPPKVPHCDWVSPIAAHRNPLPIAGLRRNCAPF